jgi:nitroreductase
MSKTASQQRAETFPHFGDREAQAGVDRLFIERWSPRAFDPAPLPKESIAQLFEAARWSMSCFNEQPWLFAYATTPEHRALYGSALETSNLGWASKAPLLGFIFAKRRFKKTGQENAWASFDTGAAWMAMTLQARLLGLYTHGMGGFDRAKAHEVTGVPDDAWAVQAAFVVGKPGAREGLPEADLKAQQPNPRRKPLDFVAIEGRYTDDLTKYPS